LYSEDGAFNSSRRLQRFPVQTVRVAYLILAHANPAHLGRLVSQLAGPESSFFVHVDAKSNMDVFRHLPDADVRFCSERVPVYWGEYSMVDAILTLVEDALRAKTSYDYCVLLSGADYPLRSTQYIHGFLTRHSGAQFISVAPIPSAEAGISLSKINKIVVPSTRPLLRVAVRAFAKVGLARRDYRRHLKTLRPYSGSTWWALTAEACQYVLDFARGNPWLCDYLRYTYSPDETIVHTIIGNSRFASEVRRSLTYDDWSAGGIHPQRITARHVEIFEQQEQVTIRDAFGPGEFLFARKFDDNSANVVNRVNEMIAAKDYAHGNLRGA
jgi:hypothetical protein